MSIKITPDFFADIPEPAIPNNRANRAMVAQVAISTWTFEEMESALISMLSERYKQEPELFEQDIQSLEIDLETLSTFPF